MSFVIRCLDCGHAAPFMPSSMHCPNCNSQWREAEYDLVEAAKTFPSALKDRSFDLWRYRELLPIHNPNPMLRLGEGGTPLIRAANLGNMLGLPNLFIKDERQGPTSSFKDRQAAVTIATLKEGGITEMVAASTGNVAISLSAYAARAGIKLWAFVTSLVPEVKMREIALYGSQVVKVTGSYDQAKQIAAEFARRRGLYQDMGARTVTAVEAMKSIAFEIAEQYSMHQTGTNSAPWKTPNWYIQAVSGGMGPLGVFKGFRELQQMGLIDRIPRLVPIQAEGCAPMVDAWKRGLAKAEPVLSPNTRIETLATGDPGRTFTMLRERVIETDGLFESVSDEDAYRAMHVLAKLEGISAEPAAAAAFAGLFKLARAGVIKPTDSVVVNCTGHTMPAEQFLFGENWTRDVDLPEISASEETPQEGLLAALNNVTAGSFPRVVVVDDSPEARRLIRRILQSQGDFEIFEAVDGREAIELVNREHPDLVILDLMMPDVDGFAVLETLRSQPDTANIPVIVATAKELTVGEKSRLQGQIQSLMQKGDFLNDEFLEEVRSLIK
ncbi:MAG TPA: pyridoxal-phosphate dependent enzyme [Anaerolineales bacterium]|nr:pyridoxal-phosphate dependent enzyme [Anaerolineales bacterium]